MMSPLQKRPREDEDEENKENTLPTKRPRILFTSEQEEKLKAVITENYPDSSLGIS